MAQLTAYGRLSRLLTTALAAAIVFATLPTTAGESSTAEAVVVPQRWNVTTGGAVHSSPVLSPDGGTVYAGSDDNHLYAVDAAKGTEQWRFETDGGVDSSPAVSADGSVVYFGSRDDHLYAVDTATGTESWNVTIGSQDRRHVHSSRGYAWSPQRVAIANTNTPVTDCTSCGKGCCPHGGRDCFYSSSGTGGKYRMSAGDNDCFVGYMFCDCRSCQYGESRSCRQELCGDRECRPKPPPPPPPRMWSSPALSPDGGTVYIGSNDNHLYAVDAATGEERWRFETDGGVDSSPTVSANGRVVYVGSRDMHLYAIDAATGTESWNVTTGSYVHSSPALSPDGGTVYVGSYDNHLYAVDSTTGAERWRFKTGGGVDSSPAVSEDGSVVYVGSRDKLLYAVDAATGAERWRFTTGGSVCYSSPVLSADDSVVYVGSDDKLLYAVDATTGAERWRFVTSGSMCSSSPAVSFDNVTVYVGSDDKHLYKVGPCTPVKAVAASWVFKENVGVEKEVCYTQGVQHTYTETNSLSWGESTTRTAGAGFSFFGLDASVKVVGTTSEQVSRTTSETFESVEVVTECFRFYPGVLWQLVFNTTDQCGTTDVFTGELVQTPNTAAAPCCLPGFFADPSQPHSGCVPGDDGKTFNLCRAPPPLMYACVAERCVEASDGIPKDDCDSLCRAPSPLLYVCEAGQCVEASGGLPKDDCERVCRGTGSAFALE